jgi:hypothetical protein
MQGYFEIEFECLLEEGYSWYYEKSIPLKK